MHSRSGALRSYRPLIIGISMIAAASFVISACGSSQTPAASSSSANSAAAPEASAQSGSSGSSTASGGPASAASSGKIGVALITKTVSNPYYVSMADEAKSLAAKDNISLTVAGGTKDGDASAQIQAIEDAVARGDKGILITAIDSSINNALTKARKAGLLVIALDSPTDPIDIADMTYATDNRAAGEAIGKWAAAKLDGKKAVIALLDSLQAENDPVDIDRDQGFLKGMGIPLNNPNKNMDEAPTGKYTSGKGGDYQIVGNQWSNGDQADGRTAMETLLSKNPSINLVYAINEPAATGAYQALKAAGTADKTLVVTIDGSCTGVGEVTKGIFGADSQQYPSKMAQLGMEAIVNFVKTGEKPAASAGLDFHDTGSQLITTDPVPGLPSITPAEASTMCWGPKA